MKIEDFKISDGDITKCDHRPASPKTSLLFINTSFLTTPDEYPCVCGQCGRSFLFVKDEKTGNYKNIKERRR